MKVSLITLVLQYRRGSVQFQRILAEKKSLIMGWRELGIHDEPSGCCQAGFRVDIGC
jgi:hypothetical protein